MVENLQRIEEGGLFSGQGKTQPWVLGGAGRAGQVSGVYCGADAVSVLYWVHLHRRTT